MVGSKVTVLVCSLLLVVVLLVGCNKIFVILAEGYRSQFTGSIFKLDRYFKEKVKK
jgi:hypothetical protein